VNSVSSYYPFGADAKPYDGQPKKGQWSYYPVMYDRDHLDFMGFDVIPQAYVNAFYADVARSLLELDK
jgi:triacylglycerol lipase